VKPVWSALALEDRRAIFAYVEADDPHAAILLDERIEAAVKRLIDFPESGRPGMVEETRELVIPHTAYIAPYRIVGDIVRILRVIHGARIWPDEMAND
jgi:addiction module RelE/StbE family toxin